MTKTIPLLFLLIATTASLYGQTDKFRTYAIRSMPDFIDLLSLPCDAHFPEDIEKNVIWAEKSFSDRGFTTQRINTDYVPLLYGIKNYADESAKTLLIYLQMDGQPVDSNFWDQPDPFIPVFKRKLESGKWQIIEEYQIDRFEENDRIFARAASDAKGPVMMFLTALDMLKDEGITPDFNIKVILDFEEEMGSPHLPDAVKKNKDLLAADYLIILDGPQHTSGKPTLAFGARGIATVSLVTYGPIFPQHSGHYGNYLTNPALSMSQLLAGMKDADGRVTLKGYYDGIKITDEVREVLSTVPDHEEMLLARMGTQSHDKIAPTLQESIQYPSLNIRGLSSGWVGQEARTIVPSTARAELDLRLVKESDPNRLIKIIHDYIEESGYTVLDHEPTSDERKQYEKIVQMNSKISYAAFRTPTDSPIGSWLIRGLKNAHGVDPVIIRTHGGSIPISPFVATLDVPAVIVPTVNNDNNQHSPNENLRLGHYKEGIKTFYYLFQNPLE